ncbi:NAD-dependent epimerase/dehydratase family protein [Rossellomorea aquimaris]|uniref:NAD-dependent epimerase/dehydratase family protein n=1 Tax=Rossellomorea aquimaris TaxID=189382 RepID=UPI001CFC5EAD|nr:NAD-dependent epimerase/dehydratase family protein [Rossellomorea aquimaris]
MKKVLITGASGFTGLHACEYYRKRGYEVYGAVRSHHPPLKGVQSVICNLLDLEAMKVIIKEIEPQMILHLAAQNHSGQSWIDPVTTINTNVIGTMNLLESVKNSSPDASLLIIGSVIEYNPCHSTEPNHPYGLSKYIQTVLSTCWSSFYDLDIRIAKASNLIGPGRSNGICSLLAHKCLQYQKGVKEGFHFQNVLDHRDFLDVRDAVQAYDIILRNGTKNETYVVASGRNYTLLEVAKKVKELSQSNLPLTTDQWKHIPGVPYKDEKLVKLGWKPTISLSQSLKEILDYHNDW